MANQPHRSAMTSAAIAISGTLVSAALAVFLAQSFHNRRRRQPTNAIFSSAGSIYSSNFLRLILPLYDLHMGCEVMGPFLYQMIRFVKPRRVLEVGAGYTSIYLLQALKDNEDELDRVQTELNRQKELQQDGAESLPQQMFLDASDSPTSAPPRLDIMDNMEHESTTAHLVQSVALKLQSQRYLNVLVQDCFQFQLDETYDFIWLDGITTDDAFGKFFVLYVAKHLSDGGYVGVHSTLTNSVTKTWLGDLLQSQIWRQLVTIEVAPTNDEVDLKELATTIQALELPSGEIKLVWLGDYETAPIGYGIEKLLLSAVIDPTSVEDYIVSEWLEEALPDSIQSIGVEFGEGEGPYQLTHLSFLEPHKRYQNSCTIFQKRSQTYNEPLYSWSP